MLHIAFTIAVSIDVMLMLFIIMKHCSRCHTEGGCSPAYTCTLTYGNLFTSDFLSCRSHARHVGSYVRFLQR